MKQFDGLLSYGNARLPTRITKELKDCGGFSFMTLLVFDFGVRCHDGIIKDGRIQDVASNLNVMRASRRMDGLSNCDVWSMGCRCGPRCFEVVGDGLLINGLALCVTWSGWMQAQR